MESFSIWHWLVMLMPLLFLWALISALKSAFTTRGGFLFCKSCGHSGSSRIRTQGSIAIEIVLWICFIVPGVIYSIWRMTTKRPVCESCGSNDLVPPDSPIALATKKQLGI